MEESVHEPSRQAFDPRGVERPGRERAGHLATADRFGAPPELRDHRPHRRLAGLHFEDRPLACEQRLDARDLSLAQRPIVGHGVLERREVGESDSGQGPAARIGGAREREIDHRERLAGARAERAAEGFGREQRRGDVDREQHRVGELEPSWQRLQRGRLCLELGRGLARALDRAVEQDQPPHALGAQMSRRLSSGHPGAHHHHRGALEIGALGQGPHRGRGDRERALADPGLAAGLASGAQRRAKQSGKEPRQAGSLGGLEGGPDLAQDLRLSEDERFQAAGDTKQMGDRRQRFETGQVLAWQFVRLARSAQRRVNHLVDLAPTRDPVQLGAIAGGEQHRVDPHPFEAARQGIAGCRRQGQTLELLEARGVVADRERAQRFDGRGARLRPPRVGHGRHDDPGIAGQFRVRHAKGCGATVGSSTGPRADPRAARTA